MTAPSAPLARRLRALADALPAGGTVSLSADALRALAAVDGEVEAAAVSGPLADLTINNVAALFRRRPGTVRGWITSGRLRAYKLNGREYRIPRDALRAFQDSERHRSEPRRTPAEPVDLGAWRGVAAADSE